MGMKYVHYKWNVQYMNVQFSSSCTHNRMAQESCYVYWLVHDPAFMLENARHVVSLIDKTKNSRNLS